MNNDELERLMLQNLKMTKEVHEYVRKIDRRQRWARNVNILYWVILIALALFGYYYAFPYLQNVGDSVSTTWASLSNFVNFSSSTPVSY